MGGLKEGEDGKGPVHLEKKVDAVVADGAQILVPMLLKVSQKQEDRAWMRVTYGGPGKSEGSQPAKKSKSEKKKKEAPEVSEEEQEQARLQFVELILKTKEVNAKTTDEATRKECLDIFVQHLGKDQGSKKKDKKKGKDKDKKKKHREDGDGDKKRKR